MKKYLFLSVLFAFMSFCIAAPVVALPTTIGPAELAVYNQQDWPVFIGYSAGPNMGFALTDYTGGDQGSFTSPTYTGTALDHLINGYGGVGPYGDFTGIGLNPLIAIDLNESNPGNPATATYWINSLDVYINDALAYQYSQQLLQTETGNGKSDFVVPGIDLTGATSLYFVLDFGNSGGTIGDNTNGKENFFLVRGDAPQVPEPATLLLLGIGMTGLSVLWRKKFLNK